MKKFYVMGMMLALVASVAFASSLSVPWFVDNAAPKCGNPPSSKVVALVYLHNNRTTEIECSIRYYSQTGALLGPNAGEQTTFVIAPQATLAFRPVADDPISDGGMEADDAGALVPNRPTTDGATNGSIVIEWDGGTINDVQGMIVQSQSPAAGVHAGKLIGYGTLLPPGVD